MKLHKFLEDPLNNVIDRVIAGHLLHMLYVRARWSDLLAVRNAMVDSDGIFFEMETRTHKGAKGAESKSKLIAFHLDLICDDGVRNRNDSCDLLCVCKLPCTTCTRNRKSTAFSILIVRLVLQVNRQHVQKIQCYQLAATEAHLAIVCAAQPKHY